MSNGIVIVGLGNFGKQYQITRHNIGFIILDKLAQEPALNTNSSFSLVSSFRSEIMLIRNFNTFRGFESIHLIKPQTYMNLSGEAVGAYCAYYKIPPEDVIVVCDDVNLPFGTLRLRKKGSAGGHNGLKSLITHLHSQEFQRLRIGIAPEDDSPLKNIPMKDYVLQKFCQFELNSLNQLAARCSDCLISLLSEGMSKTSSTFNGPFDKPVVK